MTGLTKQQFIERLEQSIVAYKGEEDWRSGYREGMRTAVILASLLAEPVSQGDEREAFEAWFKREGFGGYKDSMWAAWQARATAADAKAESREVTDQEFANVVAKVPLCISSTRRMGQNGLRNADEVYQALKDAGYRLFKG